MEKVKNLGAKVKEYANKAGRFGKAALCGFFGVLLIVLIVALVFSGLVAITAGFFAVLAMVAALLAHFLGLSTGWAIAFFLALVWIMWKK